MDKRDIESLTEIFNRLYTTLFINYLRKNGFLVKIKRFFLKSASDKYNHIFDNLGPEDIAIDCGANVGEITEKMAKGGAKVFAFEPNPFAFKKLVQRFAGNDRVKCENKAVLHENRDVRLYFHEKSDKDEVYWSTGSSVLSFKGNIDTSRYFETKSIDLVEFINGLDTPVAVLKMDIEGAECPILNKLLDSEVHKRVGVMLVETHDDKISELKEETEQLRRRIKEMNLENFYLDWT